MSKERKNKVMNAFKNNIGSYIGYGDIQEVITGITFLFWNAKYVEKKEVPQINDQHVLDVYLQSCSDNSKDLVWNVCNSIRGCIVESNLAGIFSFLNEFDEDGLIEIICDDYSTSSRFNSSTPDSLITLIYKILEGVEGKNVLDICSYTGNFLTYYAQQNKDYIYNGIEINSHSSLISKLKLIALGVEHRINTANALRTKNECFNKVFCNQPFNIRLNNEDYDYINRNNKLFNNFNKRITSDWIFVSKVINSLETNGKGAIIVPNGSLFKLPDSEIRTKLIEKGYLEAIISLPGNLFNNTMIPTTLLILSNNNDSIKFIDASKLFIKTVPTNTLDVDKILKEYKSEKDTNITKIIKNSELRDDSNLSVSCYMDAEEIEIKNPKKLAEVALDVSRGYQIMSREIEQYSNPSSSNKEYKIVNIINVNNGRIEGDLTSIYPDTDKYEKYILKDKDLVLSSKGTLNKVFVADIKKEEKYIPSGNFTVIRLNQELINPTYLKLFFESSKGEKVLNSIKSGGVLPAINIAQLKSLDVPVPSIEEQNKVVAKYLAKNDEIMIIKSKLQKAETELLDYANEEF